MSWATLNHLEVIAGRLYVPRVGCWSSELVVDTASATALPKGSAAALSLGGIGWSGTILRGEPYAGKVKLRLVGGRNKLAQAVQPRFFAGVSIREPLVAALGDVGESLSPLSHASVLGQQLPFWATVKQSCGNAMTNLMDAGPDRSIWRVLGDGTVWVGVDGFPPTKLSDFQVLEYQTQDGAQLISAELPNVFPGESIGGLSVSTVEHLIEPDKNRVKLWFEGAQ